MAKVLFIVGFVLNLSWAEARDPISVTKMNEIYSEFQYESEYEVLEMKDGANNSQGKRCHIYNFEIKTSYPRAPEDVIVSGRLYTPNPKKVAGELPFVIQLPPMGGTNVLDKWMGGTLCNHNMAGFIINNDFTGFDGKQAPPVEDHNEAHKRTISALKAAMAYAKDSPRYNNEKIGLIGISLGGILGSMAFSVLDEISAAYVVVAGGDIPHILAWSQEKRVSRLRKIRMKEEGFESIPEYEEWLREYLTYDPFDMAPRVPAETVFMVISTNDKNVPTGDQYLLHEAFGQPDYKEKSSSHAGTVISELLWANNRRKIAQWFEGRFALDNPRLEESKRLLDFGYLQNY